MRSIIKEHKDMYIPTLGWWDVTNDRNPFWPFSNSAIGHYLAVLVAMFLGVVLIFAGSEIGIWIIRSVFALFGLTVAMPSA
jgi:hypothetical protein